MRALRALRSKWQRSLQLRVVATTVLASLLVLIGVGWLVLDRVGDGLLSSKRRAALAEASAGQSYAESQLAQADRTDPASLDKLLETIAGSLDGRGSPAGLYDVALIPVLPSGLLYASRPFSSSEIPVQLSTSVSNQDAQAYAYGHALRDSKRVRTLVVGAPLPAAYNLYYVFPLSNETSTLALVQRTLAIGSGVLLMLIAGVTLLVTRQVVTPVRMAAAIAERLAAGHLEERLLVTGEDDLAKLGRSFNLMARSLQRQISQLEELSRVQRRFTADVSHELRTPLTTVRMAAEVLYEARTHLPPDTARAAELLTGELDRFEMLLGDLLEISRHDAGAAVLESEACDLTAIVRGAASAMAAVAARRGSSIDLSAVPEEPVVIEADPRRVQRVLRNLLINAVEYGQSSPVEVELAGDASVVSVRVRDHGVGLRHGEERLVFTRFWRADPSRARERGGSGLGLSLAMEDVRLHGGTLEAGGRLGVGAAFVMTLPRAKGRAVDHALLDAVVSPVGAGR